MRIAVIADIHGNALALEAVIAQLRDDAPDLVVNLGDCVSGPLWPRETADILMAQDWPTVRGNHDRWVSDATHQAMASDAYARASLDGAHLDWLRALPLTLRRDNMLMFHAQPADDNAYLLDHVTDAGEMIIAPRATVLARMAGERAPLILSGHSHLPRVVRIDGEMLALNPGSVGCPAYHDPTPPIEHWVEAGSPHARYALATKRGGEFIIDLRATPYDWDRAAAQAERNNRPEWARALATGYVR